MIKNELHKESTAMDYLGYALYAFGGLGTEILLMMIEINVWSVQNNEWTLKRINYKRNGKAKILC